MYRRLCLAAILGALAVPSCDDDHDGPYWEGGDADLHCRSVPSDCPGNIGGYCRLDGDCRNGVCCRPQHDDDCGTDGMCTYLCSTHADCPSQMLCHEGHCFFACSSDEQCATGQDCHNEEMCAH